MEPSGSFPDLDSGGFRVGPSPHRGPPAMRPPANRPMQFAGHVE